MFPRNLASLPAMSNKNIASDSQVWHTDADPNSGTVGCMEKVFTKVRQKLRRPKEDKIEQVNTNQLCVYGATADWCQDLALQLAAHSPSSTATPVANVEDDPVSQVPSADASNLTKFPMFSIRARGDSVRQHEEKFENISEYPQLTKACDDAGFIRIVLSGTILC